jgi:hypothetical protein
MRTPSRGEERRVLGTRRKVDATRGLGLPPAELGFDEPAEIRGRRDVPQDGELAECLPGLLRHRDPRDLLLTPCYNAT